MLFQPTYFSPIYQFQKLVKADEVLFEIQDNYQKQTYRTRLNIATPNGIQALTIPIKHNKGIRQKTKEVRIDNTYRWQRKHLKSLQTAYRSSPYFEFYEDEIIPLYERPHKFLLDFLFITQELSFELLQLDIDYLKTSQYDLNYPQHLDVRYLAEAKKNQEFEVKPYKQVFESKHSFIPNLSILDLLFNEGPNALSLLLE